MEIMLYLTTKQLNMATCYFEKLFMSYSPVVMELLTARICTCFVICTMAYHASSRHMRAPKVIYRLQIWYPLSVQPCLLSNSTPS